ncbi:MAG: tripartite tricarboxylate transporter permease [Microvirga sp.]
MDAVSGFLTGLSTVLSPQNLLVVFLGCLGGTLIGVLPGLGPVTTIALLLPITYYLEPGAGIMMLAGIFYGAQYGGSTTAILLRIPGENSSIMTCLDGHAMAQQGRAGPALSIAALSSLFAGLSATLLIAAFAPLLAKVGQSFGAPEYFSLATLGLVGSVVIAQGPVLKALAMVLLGLMIGTIGLDPTSGVSRYSFGTTSLLDGIDFVPLSIGLFSLGEVILHVGRDPARTISTERLDLYPTRSDLRLSFPAAVRGTVIGCLFGLLPGGGATLSSFVAYLAEKKLSRHPESFGFGAIEGLASPEAANNAGAQTSFIPMLMLGIPSNAVMAVMIAALMVHGIHSGPAIMTIHPKLFWAVVASMLVGNVILVILNLPLVGLWVQLLRIPYRLLYPGIVVICAIGVYTVRSDPFDVALAAVIGWVGVLLARFRCEPAPLLLGFVLGPMLENQLRRSMLISGGDPTIFFRRPISASMLTMAILMVLGTVLPSIRRRSRDLRGIGTSLKRPP